MSSNILLITSFTNNGSVAKCLIFTIFTFVMVRCATASGDKLQILTLWRHRDQSSLSVLNHHKYDSLYTFFVESLLTSVTPVLLKLGV